MVLVPVRYSFSQKFSVPVEEAFRWSIDYDPDDFSLMGWEGTRKVKKLSEDAFTWKMPGRQTREWSRRRGW